MWSLGRPTGMSEALLVKFILFFLVLPMHRDQQPRGRCPSNVNLFRSFDLTKASLIDPEISPTPPVIFTGGVVKKCEIWRRFQHQ